MKKHMLRIGTGLMAMVLLLSATACGKKEEDTSSDIPVVTDAPTTTTTAWKGNYNPLTGESDLTTDDNRPVAIVVSDESSALVQLGVETADMYFEAETEGGIPRMLAIYSSQERVPDAIGPVRSARPHFVKMAKALDAIYCHIGGSQTGKNTIKQLGVNDIDHKEINSTLKATSNANWNWSSLSKSRVQSIIQQSGYRTTTSTKSPFQFGDKTGTSPATTVDVKISGSYNMAFTYNAATGLYEKHRNALSTPVHQTYTGGPIAVSNVIVMFDNRTVDPLDSNRVDFDLSSGTGILASGGTSRQIKWTRTNSQLSYFEADGTPLTVANGKTYICLTSTQYKSATTVK